MIVVISHEIVSLLINHDSIRVVEVPIAFSIRSKHSKKGAFLIEYLNTMVEGVRYYDLIVVPWVDGNSRRLRKLAFGAEFKQEVAVSIK